MKLFKKLLIFMIVFMVAGNCAFCKTITKDVQIQTKDKRVIKASLTYVKRDSKKKYPVVVLLHSLGYSSEDWGSLIPKLNNSGYAVLAVDLRGHGKSVYDSGFKKKSWVYFKPKAYLKMPSDVVELINQTGKTSKKVDINNIAIVGADIGANTAILASKDLKKKPKALVLISLTTSFKGLYVPIAMAEMGGVPILSMASNNDKYSIQQQKYLAKFSQGGFYAENYPTGGMGMMMLKTNKTMANDITCWIKKYLKP